MSSTINLTGDWMTSVGSRRMTHGTGNLGTYATGGISVTAAQVGLGVIDLMDVNASGGYVFEWLPATGLVKAYDQKDPAAAGGADIPLPEVLTNTNLSAISFAFQAFGK